MPRPSRALLPFILACLVSASLDLHAQSGAALLSGLVTDTSGASIPAATVTLVHEGTRASRTVFTSEAGAYAVAGLPPGRYLVTIALSGFETLTRRGVLLATGETVRLDATLAVDAVNAAVTVTGSADTLRVDSGGLGHVVDHRRVVELPLNGRSFINLTPLVPGVALPPGSALPRVNGGRPRTNEYLFDGISVLQPEPGQVAYLPVIDAIQEFKVETNSPPAEFGRFNGGVINLTTRAGANAINGSVFGFVRHEDLNARNLFAQAGAKPLFRRQQSGFVIGGPIVRNRTFFFADYQATRQKIGRVQISTVPTLLQRNGVFTEPINGRVIPIYDPDTTTSTENGGYTRSQFPDNAIPLDHLDPVALAVLSIYPEPTSSGTANNYRRVDEETVDQDQVDVRLDHRWGQAQHIFGRLSHLRDDTVPVTPLPDGSGSVTTGVIGPTETRAWSFASSYQAVVGPFLHETRVGYTRRAVARRGVALADDPFESLGLPGIPAGGAFESASPTFVIDGIQQIGSPANANSDFRTDVTQIVDTLTWTSGRHTFKAGLDFRWSRLDITQPANPSGSFRFSTLFTDLPGTSNTGSPLASFLIGQVQTFSIDLQNNPIRNRAKAYEFFFQDEWKVNQRLTVHAGLRYTLNFPSTEVDNQAAVFNLDTAEIEYLGRDGNPRSARRLHPLDFGPRLGISAQPLDRTTVRAGYGVVWIEQAGITTPFTTPQFPFLQSVSQRTLDNITPAFVLEEGPSVQPVSLTPDAGRGQSVFAVARDLGSGYVQQWHAAVRQDFTSTLTLEVAYVGSEITRIGLPDINLNQLRVEQLALGQELLRRVPNPYYGIIPPSSSLGDPTITVAQLMKPYPDYLVVSLYRDNVGTTNYHGVTFKLEQQLRQGLTYAVSYTRSRLIDEASSVFDASITTGPPANYPVADSFGRTRERDHSTGDIPHVFVTSVVWDVPFGNGRAYSLPNVVGILFNDWTVGTILTLQSGIPLAVTQTTNFNAFAGFGVQRPNLAGDPTLPSDERTTARWFNTSAFAVAPQFTLGSASRNPVRGPDYSNMDLSLMRRVPMNWGALEFRVEVFNLMNTPPLNAPNTVLGAPGFGSITSAGDPRVVQLALKVHF